MLKIPIKVAPHLCTKLRAIGIFSGGSQRGHVGNPASYGPPDLDQIGKPANKNHFNTRIIEVKEPFSLHLTPHQAHIVYKAKHG